MCRLPEIQNTTALELGQGAPSQTQDRAGLIRVYSCLLAFWEDSLGVWETKVHVRFPTGPRNDHLRILGSRKNLLLEKSFFEGAQKVIPVWRLLKGRGR